MLSAVASASSAVVWFCFAASRSDFAASTADFAASLAAFSSVFALSSSLLASVWSAAAAAFAASSFGDVRARLADLGVERGHRLRVRLDLRELVGRDRREELGRHARRLAGEGQGGGEQPGERQDAGESEHHLSSGGTGAGIGATDRIS